MDLQYFVYILASKTNGTLYVGVTNDLVRRVTEHRTGMVDGTKKYGVTRLVCSETFESVEAAIEREKRLKRWRRNWKIALIERDPSTWRDLFEGSSFSADMMGPGSLLRSGRDDSRGYLAAFTTQDSLSFCCYTPPVPDRER